MADSRIQDLPAIDALADGDLFPVAREGDSYNARKVTAGQMTDYIDGVAQPYLTGAQEAANQAAMSAATAAVEVGKIGTAVEDAQAAQAAAEAARDEAVAAGDGIDEKVTRAETAAQTATEKAGQAATSESNAALSAGSAESAKQAAETAKQAAETAQEAAEAARDTAVSSASQASQSAQGAAQSALDAQTAKEGAEAAQAAIENLGVDATTLESGSPATVQKTVENGVVKLTFGLPSGNQGPKGDTGASMEGLEKVSGTGAPGTFDTYNVIRDDGQVVGQFQVYNGADGMGAGDMLKAVYDPTGKNTDVFAYVDQAVQDIPVPDVSAQIAEHNADVSAHPDIRAELAGKEQAGAAAGVQSNLDTHVASKQNPHATTAEQVGADPEGSAAQALTDAKSYTDEKFSNLPGGTVYVNITGNGPYTADKTFAELEEAYNAGATIFAVYRESIFSLQEYYNSQAIIFSKIYMGQQGIGGHLLIGDQSVTISSDGLVLVSEDSFSSADDLKFTNKVTEISAETTSDAILEVYNKSKQYVDAAIGAISAANVSYDNSTSGMTATDVQAAISELSVALAGGGGVKVESGSYVGTGVYGVGNPTTLQFSGDFYAFVIRENDETPFESGLVIKGDSLFYVRETGAYQMFLTSHDNSIEFYGNVSSGERQLNDSGKVYNYLVFLK